MYKLFFEGKDSGMILSDESVKSMILNLPLRLLAFYSFQDVTDTSKTLTPAEMISILELGKHEK